MDFLHYINIYTQCWSTDPIQRPLLNKIKTELERLSTNIAAEFITNNITSQSLPLPHPSRCSLSENSNIKPSAKDIKFHTILHDWLHAMERISSRDFEESWKKYNNFETYVLIFASSIF
ncbi:635_t:CDS:2 [Scutellospora calospora]|uniref:635_t:CDS:1 n=1 Tax=Scutellospora calospora TaxID=85575 RepID=A0ACA9KTR6_9GLOM|nr:635_t:CDS:2 [Scutellospora calospora]